ncbi:MAG: hypothetical protein IPJ34_38455 [Myxococcales bacterium]|nr:hypothetical protein [Myxococcales bacterium]
MGDHFQTLVVQDVDLDEAAAFGERIRAILIEQEIVRPERSTECALGSEGHAPGARWTRAARSSDGEFPDGYATNGVVIEVGRALHGFGATSLVCPTCRAAQPMEPRWQDAELAYVERGEILVVGCEACGAAALSTDWEFDWPMALGALGITFWNWPPMKRSFVDDLAGEIERPVRMVRGKL